jgi:hypothetical protein
MTTWPLYWLKAACPPDSAVSVNAGAGPPASAANAVDAMAIAAKAQPLKNFAVECFIDISSCIGNEA